MIPPPRATSMRSDKGRYRPERTARKGRVKTPRPSEWNTLTGPARHRRHRKTHRKRVRMTFCGQTVTPRVFSNSGCDALPPLPCSMGCAVLSIRTPERPRKWSVCRTTPRTFAISSRPICAGPRAWSSRYRMKSIRSSGSPRRKGISICAVMLPADFYGRKVIFRDLALFFAWKQAFGYTLASELHGPIAFLRGVHGQGAPCLPGAHHARAEALDGEEFRPGGVAAGHLDSIRCSSELPPHGVREMSAKDLATIENGSARAANSRRSRSRPASWAFNEPFSCLAAERFLDVPLFHSMRCA